MEYSILIKSSLLKQYNFEIVRNQTLFFPLYIQDEFTRFVIR